MAERVDHSIWSCCFAKGTVPRDFVRGSPVASNGGVHEIPMLISVIQPAGGEPIVVDTGFSGGESMTGRRFADHESPAEILAKFGLVPEQIRTVVLTHLHFDHVGNIDAFPEAEFLLQRYEYEAWKRVLAELPDFDAGKQSWVLSSLNPDDFVALERAIAAGRVRFVEGDHAVCPGVTLRLAADSHTFGSQWVEVETGEGICVVAGDVVASYANIERLWPPGYHQGNAWNLLHAYRHLADLVAPGRLHRIVPGHDMAVFERNPSRVIGRNPVAEIHLAAGAPSVLGTGDTP